MHIPALAISSTDIRRRVREGEPIRYLVPEGVKTYIEKAGAVPGEPSDGARRPWRPTRAASPRRPPVRPRRSRPRRITVIDVRELITITDYFVICSGASDRQVDTIADEVECGAEGVGRRPSGAKADPGARWQPRRLRRLRGARVRRGGARRSTGWRPCGRTRPVVDWEHESAEPGPNAAAVAAGRLGAPEGPVAQLVERLLGRQEVRGSNPLRSTQNSRVRRTIAWALPLH